MEGTWQGVDARRVLIVPVFLDSSSESAIFDV